MTIGTNGDDRLEGGPGDDLLEGVGGNDTLIGLGGNDVLIGGAGVDRTEGGAGDDIHHVESNGDVVIELSGEGNDEVRTVLSRYTLPANVERLIATGSSTLGLRGNGLDNVIHGTAGSDVFHLQDGGNDTVFGNGASDYFYFGAAFRHPGDSVHGGAGRDYLILQGTYNLRLSASALFSGIESIHVYSGGENRYGGATGTALNYDLAIDDSLLSAGSALEIHAGGLVPGERLAFDGSLETDARFTIYGGSGQDRLAGGGGNDFIDGGADRDRMAGGGGNDIYYVDNVLDIVLEDIGGGYDHVYTSVNLGLAAGQEIEFLGTRDKGSTIGLTLRGNEFANSIGANNGNNSLYGEDGNDKLYGFDGNDNLFGGVGRDYLIGGLGNDVYWVDDAFDIAQESAGEGFDSVFTSVSYKLRPESEIEQLATIDNSDTIGLTLIGNGIQNTITGNAGNNKLYGEGGNDSLRGLDGSDNLFGGAGDDNMFGGRGNDVYWVDDALDVVVEAAGEGIDSVSTSVSYTLRSGSEIEMLGTQDKTGLSALVLTGNEIKNTIAGNAGNNELNGAGGDDNLSGLDGDDRLIGGIGADYMAGGLGNDLYFVDHIGDRVAESAGGGTDTVHSSVSFGLAGQDLENLILTGGGPIDGTGNGLANSLTGNGAANRLDGGAGADAMSGGAGNDIYVVDDSGDLVIELAGGGNDSVQSSISYTLGDFQESLALTGASNLAGTGNGQANDLLGNAGANLLNGLAGADTLTGGGGADRFAFTTALVSGTFDTITDFVAEKDKILLGGFDGQPFAALASGALGAGAFRIGTGAVDQEHRIIYNSATGALLYDADGAGGSAAVQFARVGAGLSLTAGDFLVDGLANQLPVITSGSTATVAENSATSTIVYQTVVQDADGDSLTLGLGGPDATAFTIDAAGAVRFISSPDFETKSSYSFSVSAKDSSGSATVRNVVVSITDVSDTSFSVITETAGANDSAGNAQAIDRGLFSVQADPELPDASLPSVTIEGAISSASDVDYFSVFLQEGELLILDVDNSGGNLDSLLKVFQSGQFTPFASNDDLVTLDPGSAPHPEYGHNTDSFMRFRAPSSGTFYFSIESFQDPEHPTFGSYDLHVSIGPPATRAQINEENIQSLLSGASWSTTSLTYGFTTSSGQYGPGEGTEEIAAGMSALNIQQQGAVRTIVAQIANVTNLTFTENSLNPGSAQLRYARSDLPETAHASYPGTGDGGDSWYNTTKYNSPVVGNYQWMTFLHETGHALGLKHGHESPALSPDRDSVEFSVMTYRSHTGDPVGEGGGYTNETWGYAQTLMMYDIAALQRLYGADFSINSGNNVYSWSPTTGAFMIDGATQWTPGGNRIFMTLWDGGGTDTYDLSNYSSASGSSTIDLRPGEWVKMGGGSGAGVQTANLGGGIFARGNVANSLLYNDDARSLIENAIGSQAPDYLIGNEIANRLTGGGGGDTFRWYSATDSAPGVADSITDFARFNDVIDLSQMDANITTAANDAFVYLGTGAFMGISGQVRWESVGSDVHIFADVNGDALADMQIIVLNVTDLTQTEFIL